MNLSSFPIVTIHLFEFASNSVDDVSFFRHCMKPVLSCNGNYRSFNGVCNNRRHSDWGSASSCLIRLLPAYYSDGISAAVGVKEGLPSSSGISVQLERIPKRQKSSPINTSTSHLFFAFGQFLDHDIASSIVSSINTAINPGSDCCLTPSLPQCSMALNVSSDPFYRRHNVSCINFVRSARCPCSSTRERQQMNGATAFMDLSQIYGNSELEAVTLRHQQKKYLLDSYDHGVLLPIGGSFCISSKCFRAADARVNQQAALTSMHTIFLRYHNYLAVKLRNLNPRWSSDRVFEEARRINIAQYQVIIIKEFLPLLLGETFMREKGISFEKLSRGSKYDTSLRPGMFNEFLTAAFRLHTIIPDTLSSGMAFNFFDTNEFFHKGKDHATDVVKALMASEGREATFPVSDVTAHHVYDTDGDFGLDLVAINVQRGRDHGLRPYTDYVAHLQNINIAQFDDLHSIMNNEAVEALKKLYKNVADIDLYVGGYLEQPRHGLLSVTMAEIVAKQFQLLIEADRFFVTHENNFTQSQLGEILKSSLAEILCLTTNLESIPQFPMEKSSSDFDSLCKNVQRLNISHWLVR